MAAAHAGPEARVPDHSGFSHPREVVACPDLPEDQRHRILLDWLQDEFALLVADNDGMLGSRSPRPDQVLAALQALDQATEVWRRSSWTAR